MPKSGQHFEYASCNFVSKMNDLIFFFLTVCQNLLAYKINRDQITFCLLSTFLYVQYGVFTKKMVINGTYSNLPFFSKNKNIQCSVHTASFDGFLSDIEGIINLEFFLVKLFIFFY